MNDIIASGTLQSIKLLFQKKVERNVIIDPFSCLIKLSLLRYLESGTKISIYQNRIHFNSPSYIQGIIRFMYGDNREHLHNLYLPIQKSVEWFWDEKNEDMTYMFNNAIIGLKMLKYAYNEYATIQHTIDYYIIIMMQKNTQLISKIGINLLDIDKITECMMECSSSKTNNKSSDKQPSSDKHPSDKHPSDKQSSDKQPSDKQPQENSKKHKKQDTTTTLKHINDEDIVKTINAKDIRDSIVLSQEKESRIMDNDNDNDSDNLNQKKNHNKDMHKFLFEIWNPREIGIVINLYKEMELKQKGYERDNIYSNIMSYCSMKENKLFDYIQQNSSVL